MQTEAPVQLPDSRMPPRTLRTRARSSSRRLAPPSCVATGRGAASLCCPAAHPAPRTENGDLGGGPAAHQTWQRRGSGKLTPQRPDSLPQGPLTLFLGEAGVWGCGRGRSSWGAYLGAGPMVAKRRQHPASWTATPPLPKEFPMFKFRLPPPFGSVRLCVPARVWFREQVEVQALSSAPASAA